MSVSRGNIDVSMSGIVLAGLIDVSITVEKSRDVTAGSSVACVISTVLAGWIDVSTKLE